MRGIKDLFKGSRLICYVSLVLTGVIMIVWLTINRSNVQECLKSHRIRNREMAKVKSLKKHLEDLREEKQQLEGGKDANELAVRNRFRMIKPGEHLVLIEHEEEKEGKK
jgi:cell division protein FtsB